MFFRSFALISMMAAISAFRSFIRPAYASKHTIMKASVSTISDWTEARAIFQDSDRPQIAFSASSTYDFLGDLLVIPFYKPKEKGELELLAALRSRIPSGLSPSIISIVEDLLAEGNFKGDIASKQMTKIVGNSAIKYLCLVGLGPDPKSEKAQDMEITSANRLGKAIGAVVKESKIQSLAVIAPAIGNAGITHTILGLYESAYSDNRYKSLYSASFFLCFNKYCFSLGSKSFLKMGIQSSP